MTNIILTKSCFSQKWRDWTYKLLKNMKQGVLFEDFQICSPGRKRSRTYEGFVEKFKPKLTTDDCYTPPAVYDAVLGWVKDNIDIEGCRIVRPFYPGGDYESEVYEENDVVVDNPPFSIITKIVRFYMAQNVRFFLFAPHLTAFQPGRFCSSIICDVCITYANGAKVATDFVTNMLGDVAFMTCPKLRDSINVAQKGSGVSLPKYDYPVNVVSAALLGKIANVPFVTRRNQVEYIRKLDSQKGKAIFGGGYLISDKLAAERAAARETIIWELSAREVDIIKQLE